MYDCGDMSIRLGSLPGLYLVVLSCPPMCRSSGSGLHRKIEFAEASWYGMSVLDIRRLPV
jgi:hypothetical protein